MNSLGIQNKQRVALA